MEIKQKRYSNRTGFAFGEDELKYSLQHLPGIGSEEPVIEIIAATPTGLLLN